MIESLWLIWVNSIIEQQLDFISIFFSLFILFILLILFILFSNFIYHFSFFMFH